ncbi:MAG: hypothetical protein ACRCWP_01675, partial [Shewanella sp.]
MPKVRRFAVGVPDGGGYCGRKAAITGEKDKGQTPDSQNAPVGAFWSASSNTSISAGLSTHGQRPGPVPKVHQAG